MKGWILVKYNVMFLLEEVVCTAVLVLVFGVKYYCVQVCAQQYSARVVQSTHVPVLSWTQGLQQQDTSTPLPLF